MSSSPVSLWEIPGECTLEGLEFWQTGHYGPICRGTIRRKDIPSAVVVKTLRGICLYSFIQAVCGTLLHVFGDIEPSKFELWESCVYLAGKNIQNFYILLLEDPTAMD